MKLKDLKRATDENYYIFYWRVFAFVKDHNYDMGDNGDQVNLSLNNLIVYI